MFFLTNTNAVALICEAGEIFHIDFSGRLSGLHNQYNDYGYPFERLFRFPTMNFGSYDNRKNVNSVIVTLGAYELENTELWYLTDYETRKDLTNLQVVGDAEYEDNRVVGCVCRDFVANHDLELRSKLFTFGRLRAYALVFAYLTTTLRPFWM